MSITVIAPLSLDNITTPQGEIKNSIGGPALHFALSASILSKVNIVSLVGNDYPRAAFELFHEKGCDVEGLLIRGENTINIDIEYQNSLLPTIELESLYPYWEPVVPKKYIDSEIAFLSNMDTVIQMDVLKQLRSKVKVIESSSYWFNKNPEQFLELITLADIAILDIQSVLALSSEEEHPLRLAESLLQEYNLSLLIINKFEEGITVISSTGERASLSLYHSIPFIDPHCFMDSLYGAFFSYILKKKKWDFDIIRKALNYAIVLASFDLEAFSHIGIKSLSYKQVKERAKVYTKINQILDF